MVVHDMNAASPWANASTSSAGVPPGSPRLSMLASVSRFPGGSNRSVDLLDHGAVESAAFVPSFRPSASVDIAADPETTARGIDAATLQAARGCIDVAMRLVRRVAVEPKDMSDAEWVGLHGASLLDRLLGSSSRSERAHLSQLATLHRLCSAAKDVLAAQPTLVNVRAPVKIFGDIHGQLRDLLLLWAEFGSPSHRSGDLDMCSYVFNGDWVDRGRHQLEVVTLLFALKVRYPDRIWLVRGNHECADLNSTMTANGQNGFDGACADAFGETDGHRVFQWFHETFAYLPLAACVEKSILVLHGGIGNGDFDLDDVRRISRPLDHDACWSNRLVREILWSDPVRHDGSVGRGVHRSPRDGGRGDVVCFGADVTAAFCRRNGLRVVVRSHQYEELGFRIMHNGHLITVFSARDYDQSVVTGGAHTNSGAILLVTDVGNNDSEESADRRILRIKAKVLYARARSPASARGTPGGVFGARIAEEQAAAAAAADADADADADDEMGR
jgi:diadenosine tetraphosphatase ApaH/serine/threonine PP2A family protein phosphatase